MPGDSEKCRLNAVRYTKLCKRAQDPDRREKFAALAETWTRLAAELEADQALLKALSELQFDQACYAEPEALNLQAA